MNRRLVLLVLVFAALVYRVFVVHQVFLQPDIAENDGFSASVQSGELVVQSVTEHLADGELSPAAVAGLQPGDVILGIYNGQSGGTVESFFDYGARMNQADVTGNAWTLAIERPMPGQIVRRPLTLTLPPLRSIPWTLSQWLLMFGIYLWVPLLTIGAGAFAGLLRPRDNNALLASVMFIALSFLFFERFYLFPPGVREMGLILQRTGSLFAPALLLWFALRFPDRSQLDIRAPWIKTAVFATTGLIWLTDLAKVGVAHFSFSAYHSTQRVLESLLGASVLNVWENSRQPLLFLIMIAGLAVLVLRYVQAESKTERRRLRFVTTGGLLGLLPLIVLRVLATWGLTAPIWLIFTVVLTVGLFPLTFVYAVVRHELFGVRVILRSGLRYALVSRGFLAIEGLALFLLIYYLAGPLLTAVVPMRASLVPVLSAGAALVLAAGLRKFNQRVMPAIDRRFFREAYNAERILLALSRVGKKHIGKPELLLSFVTSQLMRALHPRRVAVFLIERDWNFPPEKSAGLKESYALGEPDDALFRLYRYRRDEQMDPTTDVPPSLVSLCPKSFVFGSGENEREIRALECGYPRPSSRAMALCDRLEALEPRLIIPLSTNGELLGFVALGEKMSEEPYTSGDKELLMAVAEQVAVGLGYSQLIHEQAEQELLKREVDVAKEVQRKLFPARAPDTKALACLAQTRFSRAMGGDYYDFIEPDEGLLGIAFGDVSGKGLPAALLMASLQAMLRSQAERFAKLPARLAASLNRQMEATADPGNYATFFYGLFDERSLRLAYVNAGHNPPLVLRRPARPLRSVGAMAAHDPGASVQRLESTGMPLGWFADGEFEERSLQLEHGDMLFIYSDGLIDATDPSGKEFGEDRLIEFARTHAHLCGVEFREKLLAELGRFLRGNLPNDDISFVIAEVR